MILTPHACEQINRARADRSRELAHISMMNYIIAFAWDFGFELNDRDVSREAFRCLDYDSTAGY